MSVETLELHVWQRDFDLTSEKVELERSLQEKGVLNFGWSILPKIIEIDLEKQDLETIKKVIENAGPLSTNNGAWANTVAQRLSALVEREMATHCTDFFVPEGSNRLKNAIDLIELSHKPKRWKTIANAVDMALE